MNIQNSGTWAAWYNMMPGSPPTLHVTGSIDVGNVSDAATIVFDSIEKSNPPNLVLRIDDKTIFVPRDLNDHSIRLHYSEQNMVGAYRSIKIIYNDRLIHTIPFIGIAY